LKNHNQPAPGALIPIEKTVAVIPKTPTALRSLKVYPGLRIFELIVYNLKGEPTGPGWTTELGGGVAFDPEKAEIREVDYKDASVYIFGTSGIHNVEQTPGNFIEAAINASTARRKIINKYFK